MRKSIKVASGVRLNVSKSSVGASGGGVLYSVHSSGRRTLSAGSGIVPGVLVLESLADKHDPRTHFDSKCSLPFAIAALLVRRRLLHGGDDPGPRGARGRTSGRARATPVPDLPESFPAWIRIETHDGHVVQREVAHQRGGPENTMTHDDVVTKYAANASLALEAGAVAAFGQNALHLEWLADVGECFVHLRAAQRPALDAAPSTA
jgi:2-methylcitrate dehydratase PrpD